MDIEIKSTVSQTKKDDIEEHYNEVIEELKIHRKKHKEAVLKRENDFNRPAWVRVNPGPPINNDINSYRLCLGFKNIGCAYREKDEKGLGCFNCGYYASTALEEVNDEAILEQFRNAIKVGYKTNIDFNSIEFLNDGSFFNKDEINEKLREKLFEIISTMPSIKRILVESRPEFIDEESVQSLIEILRDDQLFEVGIGLESADDFVREKCINKGFNKEEYEEAIYKLAMLEKRKPKRLAIVTYLLVKPAFLSEKECINDVISSIKYLKAISDKNQVKITPKLEPAAIVDGTILSMFHENDKSRYYYQPLNYWSILEILARITIDNKLLEILDFIRIGAREDMDDIIMAPAIYDEKVKVYYPFDFVIYESIQKYNQHHDIYRLFSIITEVYKKSNGVELIEDSSLKAWRDKNKISKCSIEKIISDKNMISEILKRKDSHENEIEFMIMIYKILDIMEGYNKEHKLLKKDIDRAIEEKKASQVSDRIGKCFEKIYPQIFVEIKVNTLSVKGNKAEVFFDVKDLIQNNTMSIWSKFALLNE
jgi:radical SAM enzyme (TIGR01210 family)